jgi:hypothetical protein
VIINVISDAKRNALHKQSKFQQKNQKAEKQ